jgi:hypothetical protein
MANVSKIVENIVESVVDDAAWDSAEAVFKGGDCGTFAFALHQKTGWKAMASDNHVWLINPDGKAVDVMGVHSGATAHLEGDENLTVKPYRLSARDVTDRDNLIWATQLIEKNPQRFGIDV